MNRLGTALAVSFVFLAACGGGKLPAPSEASIRAAEEGKSALAAMKKGDHKRALAYYEEALNINRSVENTDGMAINLLNMAIVHGRSGDRLSAHRLIDGIVNTAMMDVSPAVVSEAAFYKAVLHFDSGQMDEAVKWADSSLSQCARADCKTSGRIYNLLARISIAGKDFAGALAVAERGWKLNKDSGDFEEEANSLRLMAEARSLGGNVHEAIRLYEEALLLDKAIGLSRKIALDLMGAGGALCRAGRAEEGKRYYERARSVGKGAVSEEIINKASEAIKACGGP